MAMTNRNQTLRRKAETTTLRLAARPGLACTLAFHGAAQAESIDTKALVAWLQAHLVTPGFLPAMPATVQEPGAGVVALADRPEGAAAVAYEDRVRSIVRTARLRVVAAVQGLVARPVDDRFLHAAIFEGRVVRDVRWSPHLKGTEKLSDVVLAALASDVLTHREAYDALLCICAVCGDISFSARELRTRCQAHAMMAPDDRPAGPRSGVRGI